MEPIIRLAQPDDLPQIMIVEEEEFGSVGDEAAASYETMEHRLKLLNSAPPGWFWVAEYDGQVVADIILQPTNLEPDDCRSWAASTDDGMLTKTFDPQGKNIFAVSLAISKKAPPGTAEYLVHRSLLLRKEGGHTYYMFCSRMPGFEAATKRRRQITPDEYWQQTRSDGTHKDWMLREYSSMFGEKPNRLCLNGWPTDKESGGHSVLFAVSDPKLNLQSIAERIARAEKVNAGKKRRRDQV